LPDVGRRGLSQMPRYFRERGRPLRQDSLAAEWGECARYVEIADDRYASRQVEDYGGSRVLRYDRGHWCDPYGQLFGCLFSLKRKAIQGRLRAAPIEAQEFERAWRAALGSPLWRHQMSQSLTANWGAVPFWLRGGRAGRSTELRCPPGGSDEQSSCS
jgi:hypothetical protein